MGKPFTYKPVDQEGMETLDVISAAHNFNRWMYDTIRPYCKGDILEIGSGIGNISSFFIDQGSSIHLSDIREVYCERLKKEFSSHPGLLGIDVMDITAPDFENAYPHLQGRFDTVFILNVVEHIEDDQQAITNCRKLLKPGGQLIVLVPAFQSLYNGFDVVLEHYRRYNKQGLTTLLEKSDFDIVHRQYFNLAGILGWFISGKLEKNKTIPLGEIRLYDFFVPLFRLVDRLFFRSFGLSVVAVGRK